MHPDRRDPAGGSSVSGHNVLDVTDLSVEFADRSSGWRSAKVRVVDRVSFHVAPGEIVGLVGESGSGKSTTARAVLRLVPAVDGRVVLLGTDITDLGDRRMRQHRRDVQMVFQDPYSSLDPAMTVRALLAEAIRLNGRPSKAEVRDRAAELLRMVGLDDVHLDRYPSEFSGGQRQRIAIARALATDPRLIVCDEAVSALDVSTQHQIVELLRELRDRTGVALLFIAHDLAVVRKIADRTLVMYGGWIVESAPSQHLFSSPRHPYTLALLSAVPIPAPVRQRRRSRIVLSGDVPNPAALPSGCRFQERCPLVFDQCRHEEPPARVFEQGEVRCHLSGLDDGLRLEHQGVDSVVDAEETDVRGDTSPTSTKER